MARSVERSGEVRRGGRVVRLDRLDQRWWPDAGLAKADLLAYYDAVASVLLPHLRDRPFTLKRYPNGPRGPCFWIKDAPPGMPDWIPVCSLPAKSRRGRAKQTVDYPLVDEPAALLWMANHGCVDLHVWLSRCVSARHPDFVLFDLDPAGVPLAAVAETARLLRETLALVGLESHVRTSGGDGLHVHVPLAPVHTYEETRRFAEIVARAARAADPRLVTLDRDLARRRGVFVDTKMNGEGMTIVAPYSARPRPGAPVSTPLAWDEVGDDLDPGAWTIGTVPARVAERGDLWEPLLAGRARLDEALAALA